MSLNASPIALAWIVMHSISHEGAHERHSDSGYAKDYKAGIETTFHNSCTPSRH